MVRDRRGGAEIPHCPLACRIDRCVVTHKLETRIDRLLQRDLERMVIDLLQTGDFLGLTLRIFLRSFDLGNVACWWECLFGSIIRV